MAVNARKIRKKIWIKMKSLALSDNWDIAINGDGNFYFIDGILETQQAVSHMVYTFSGEDPFNANGGIPYFEKILFQRDLSPTVMESYIRNEVRDMDDVLDVFLSQDINSEDILSKIKDNFRANIFIRTTDGDYSGDRTK